jgi:uncharacterized protein YprB with RNaseH-like and TPR domain
MLSESRKKKLAMLTKSIANGDIARASELLRTHGHSGVNRHGKKRDESKEADLNENSDSGKDATAGPSGPVLLVDACPGEETIFLVAQPPSAVSSSFPSVSYSVTQQPENSKTQPRAAVPQKQQDMGKMPMLRYWTIRKGLAQVDPENVGIASRYATVMRGSRQRFDELEASAALCHVANSQPEDLLFMDIESCGLYGTSVFLIGLMYFRQGELRFEQCLARTYAEEEAILRVFASRLEETGVLVTFNGRAFDMNMIRDRCAFHRLEIDDARVPHLDLLYESRRRWKGKLPNCRLQTLETHLCGRRRYGDIPGWAIPDAYHRFVDTGDARQMRDILHHNLLDMLTMAEILTMVLTGEDPAA